MTQHKPSIRATMQQFMCYNGLVKRLDLKSIENVWQNFKTNVEGEQFCKELGEKMSRSACCNPAAVLAARSGSRKD